MAGPQVPSPSGGEVVTYSAAAAPAPRSGEHQPQGRAVQRRPAALPALLFATAVGLAMMGMPLGVVAFENALLDNGVFASYCVAEATTGVVGGPADGAATAPMRCDRQSVLLGQVFQWVGIAASLPAWPAGLLADRHGPFALMRGAIMCFGVGLGVCGLFVSSGVPFVIGITLVAASGSAAYSMAVANVVALADGGCRETGDTWRGIVSAAVDTGYMLAVPLGFLLDWDALPLWVWFMIIGGVLLAGLAAWHRVAVAPLQRRSTHNHGDALDAHDVTALTSQHEDGGATDDSDCAPTSASIWTTTTTGARRYLVRGDLWLAILEFSLSSVFLVGFLAAAGRIAPFFGVPERAAALLPVAVGITGLLYQGLAATGITDRPRLMLGLRLATLSLAVMCFALPAIRGPFAFWAAFSLGFVWRTCALVVSLHTATAVGAGGDEGQVVGMVLTISGFVNMSGQPITYVIGSSTAAAAWTALALGVACAVLEVLLFAALQRLHSRAAGVLASGCDAGSERAIAV